ncbi:hypothetical protein [Mycobacterium simiae]|uniref:hypothetical protein n=1 Tax=Mycobacterium simiae TaxID=1784 RepID=UPI002F2B4F27
MLIGDADDRDNLVTRTGPHQQARLTTKTPKVSATFGERRGVANHGARTAQRVSEGGDDRVIHGVAPHF